MRRGKFYDKALQSRRTFGGNKKTHGKRLLRIFRTLLKTFGERGWWPVTKKGFKPEYRPGWTGKLSSKEMFEICAGAILTQNAAWSNARKAVENLNRRKLMSPEKIISAKSALIQKAVKPSGYFRQKSIKLKKFASYVSKKHSGKLKTWFEKSDASYLREELLSLYGIGPETADSMILYAAGKPEFIPDAYTLRIFSRLGFEGLENYGGAKSFFEKNLPADANLFGEYHALIVELGKNYCKKRKPLCGECPLEKKCEKRILS